MIPTNLYSNLISTFVICFGKNEKKIRNNVSIFLPTPSRYYKCKFLYQHHYHHFTDYIPSSDFKKIVFIQTETLLSTSTI